MRRRAQRQQLGRRAAQRSARCQVVSACQAVVSCGGAVIQVTRHLGVSDRTVRRWRHADTALPVVGSGRPPQCASRDDRNLVYRFLKERGATTPLVAVQAAFKQLRRADVEDLVQRFRRVARRRARRYQSRLEWRRVGAVWAADFKERREPLEGRYGWILAVKDLASRCQLAWQPVVEATAETVQAIYARLIVEHGPPLVLKSDNGGQFKDDKTKLLLAAHGVVPLYSPKRHPQYNGGIERANGQLASYQEALAEFHARPAGPTYADALGALELANDLARPAGWRGKTARELWEHRSPITSDERASFLAAVAEHRAAARTNWNFAAAAPLTHYEQAAVDRRAVRDALLQQDLLRIHPRRSRAATKQSQGSFPANMQSAIGAGTIVGADEVTAPPTVGGATDQGSRSFPLVHQQIEEAHSSANKLSAGGQN